MLFHMALIVPERLGVEHTPVAGIDLAETVLDFHVLGELGRLVGAELTSIACLVRLWSRRCLLSLR